MSQRPASTSSSEHSQWVIFFSGAVTVRVAPNAFEGKFRFLLIFYFNFSNRSAPLLMSEMLFSLSGGKKRMNRQAKSTRQNQGGLNANLIDLYPKMSGSWLCQILHLKTHFYLPQLLLCNDYSHPDRLKKCPLFEKMLYYQTIAA